MEVSVVANASVIVSANSNDQVLAACTLLMLSECCLHPVFQFALGHLSVLCHYRVFLPVLDLPVAQKILYWASTGLVPIQLHNI